MKIAVIGTGYVGLVTGTCLAETGNEVICVDIDEAKVAKMQQGEVPIYEPHLDVLFERNIEVQELVSGSLCSWRALPFEKHLPFIIVTYINHLKTVAI